MPFTERDFQDACRQLDNPDVSEYEFFVESTGVKIYRKYNAVSIASNSAATEFMFPKYTPWRNFPPFCFFCCHDFVAELSANA